MAECPVGQLRRLRTVKLSAQEISLLAVKGNDVAVGLRITIDPLQPAAESIVQGEAVLLRESCVSGVMDQNVLELITASLDQAGGMQIDNQISPQSLVEIRLEVIWGCDGGEGVAGEDLSNNRRLLQQSTDLLGQAVEARGDQSLDRDRVIFGIAGHLRVRVRGLRIVDVSGEMIGRSRSPGPRHRPRCPGPGPGAAPVAPWSGACAAVRLPPYSRGPRSRR